MKSVWGIFSSFIWVSYAFASAATPTAGPSEVQREEILRHNAIAAHERTANVAPFEVSRPFAEYEEAAYFLINDEFSYESRTGKVGMVKNLPEGVTAVIVVATQGAVEAARQTFLPYIKADRLKVVVASGGGGFWARDSLPLAVYVKGGQGRLGFIDHRYYHGNEPDKALGQFFQIPIMSHNYYYEGGNFMADREGNCVAVRDRIKDMSDEFFQTYYGCKTLRRLVFKSGIGHVDERAKFLNDKLIVTDEPSYISDFEKDGYKVVQLPRPGRPYETYANTLLVNGTIFLPTFNHANDAVAKKVYEDLGYKVFGYPSTALSNNGHGSLHCITMTYPKMAWSALLNVIGAKE